jgi:hypothetical protein
VQAGPGQPARWDAAGGEVGARRLLGERLGREIWERWDPGEREDM